MSSIVEAFARTARTMPERVAVRTRDGVTTYAELLDAVMRVAAGLREHGVARGDVVGVHLRPSPSLPAALLGTMAAGAAYLPLDPALPARRLERCLTIAAASCAITDDGLAASIPLYGIDELLTPRTAAGPLRAPSADDLAYVIFTSGSTGEPKGVMCEHGSVHRSVEAITRFGYVVRDDRILVRTSIGFDASVWELFAPLIAGAELVIGARGTAGPDELLDDVLALEPTLLQVVPTLLDYLLTSPRLRLAGSLRAVSSGGEALRRDVVERFHEASQASLVNLYGPTESTVYVTHYLCPRGERGDVPLGHVVEWARILVLDEHGRVRRRGETGELFVTGPCVARGYVNRPELTAGRFTHAPDDRFVRMYRTGDLGFYDHAGLLHYRGRADRQVKVAGVRIELGEVESALRSHASGGHAAVVAARTSYGENVLVGFVADPTDTREVRKKLREVLPSAMVPARLIRLPSFPQLSNAKTDYTALQAHAERALTGE